MKARLTDILATIEKLLAHKKWLAAIALFLSLGLYSLSILASRDTVVKEVPAVNGQAVKTDKQEDRTQGEKSPRTYVEDVLYCIYREFDCPTIENSCYPCPLGTFSCKGSLPGTTSGCDEEHSTQMYNYQLRLQFSFGPGCHYDIQEFGVYSPFKSVLVFQRIKMIGYPYRGYFISKKGTEPEIQKDFFRMSSPIKGLADILASKPSSSLLLVPGVGVLRKAKGYSDCYRSMNNIHSAAGKPTVQRTSVKGTKGAASDEGGVEEGASKGRGSKHEVQCQMQAAELLANKKLSGLPVDQINRINDIFVSCPKHGLTDDDITFLQGLFEKHGEDK